MNLNDQLKVFWMAKSQNLKKKEFSNIFGKNLLKYRTARGWTQKELSERTDIARMAIEYIEKGLRQNPPAWMIYRLAEVFKIQPGDLWNTKDSLSDFLPSLPLDHRANLSPVEFAKVEQEELTGHEYRLLQMLYSETTVLKNSPIEQWYKFIRILRKELPPRF